MTAGGNAMELSFEGGAVEVVGALDFDRSDAGITPRRLPAWTRPQIPDLFMDFMVTLGSGVRVILRTDSPWIELDAATTGFNVVGSPVRPVNFDLVVDGTRVARTEDLTGTRLIVDPVTADLKVQQGEPVTVRFDDLGDAMKTVEIWLPQNAATQLRAVRVADGSAVEPAPRTKRRWAHYGSSISHCLEAHGPTEVWPAVAASVGEVDLLQFGFAGQCQLDQFVARSIVAQRPDLISLKVGINVVNANSFTTRTFASAVHGFLDTLRDALPDTPILVVSPIICPLVEDHPGPTIPTPDGTFRIVADRPAELVLPSLTLRAIRAILAAIVTARQASGDSNLTYVDGLELFGEADAPTLPDGLHPDGDGYLRIAERFAAIAFAPGGPFAPPG